MQLQIDKARFIEAFYKVVKNDKELYRLVLPRMYNKIREDFTGTMRKETFDIIKRRGPLDPIVCIAEGRMVNGHTGELTLELRMRNNFAFNYIQFIVAAIPLTLLTGYLVYPVMTFFKPDSDTDDHIYTVFVWSTLFALVLYIELMLAHTYMNYLQRLYTKVIREIEKQALQ
jgi:hypothetical protein